MEILKGNRINNLKSLVKKYAKYQKVMLLYDENISNEQTQEVYNSIKEDCIYNQFEIKKLDYAELNNGYKLVIYFCCIDSFLKLNFNRAEFVNIYMPIDKYILPLYLHNNYVLNGQNFLLLETIEIDVSVYTSIVLAEFYTCVKNIVNQNEYELNFSSVLGNGKNMVQGLQNLNENIEFVDVQILKETGIDYEYLSLVDLVLIDAILVFIKAVRNKSLSLVDVYKSAKDDIVLIDKFYTMSRDISLLQMLNINFNCIYNLAVKTKQEILINMSVKSSCNIDTIIHKVKNTLKNSNNFLGYLYLYNVFGV